MSSKAVPLAFPEKVLDQHMVVLGKTGAGKSSALRHVVEHLLARDKRVCVIDPKGDWWGLKVAADGRGPGFPVILFGTFKSADAGDVPVNDRSGKHVADLVAGGNRPCVIGMSGWRQGEMTRFWIEFASTLFTQNRGELYLVVDEFHNFAPKGKILSPEAGEAIHWSNRVLSEGRGLGIVCLTASQRPQKVHNDSLTSHETLVAMRVIHKADRDAVRDWIDGNGDPAVGRKVLDSLAGMARGQGWMWSPEIKFGPEMVTFPMFTTFDSFAPPQLQRKVSRAGWADVNLDEVKQKLAAVIEEKRANDPKELRKQIAELTKQLTATQKPPPAPTVKVETKTVEKPVLTESQIARLEKAADRLEAQGKQLIEKGQSVKDECLAIKGAIEAFVKRDVTRPLVKMAARPTPSLTRLPRAANTSPQPARDSGNGELDGPTRKILYSLAWWRSIDIAEPTIAQLAPVAGYAQSGSFDTYLSRMGTSGLIVRERGRVRVTDEGEKHLPHVDPPESLADLHQKILATLDGPQTKIIQALTQYGGEAVPLQDLAAASGYQPSGSFDTYLSRLGTRGLIVRSRGVITPTDVLFPAGLE